MFPITDSVSSAVHYNPADTGTMQSAPLAEAHAGSSSELNTKLLKELVTQLVTSDKGDKLESIRTTLDQHYLDTSAEDFNKSKLFTALAQLKTANDRMQPSDDVAEMLAKQKQQVKNSAQVLADIQREVATNRTKANYSVSQFAADKQRALQAPAYNKGELSTHTSYAELWEKMALAIKNIKSNYVDFYADLMQKYTEMYEAYNKYVQGAASKAVSAGKDGNNIKFDPYDMKGGYQRFNEAKDGINLGSVKNWGKMSSEERANMRTTLAPAFEVNDSGEIRFNLKQYDESPKYPSGVDEPWSPSPGLPLGGTVDVSTAGYQAWLASFNSVGSALQNNMQAFAQRYTQANSTFDNLNKVLSGAIASLSDSAKDVIRAFS